MSQKSRRLQRANDSSGYTLLFDKLYIVTGMLSHFLYCLVTTGIPFSPLMHHIQEKTIHNT